MKHLISVFCIIFFLTGCKDESVNPDIADTTGKELVKVQVDLQTGFSGNLVHITLNDEPLYQSILSDQELLAGPQASFISYLPKGKNTLTVFTTNVNVPTEVFSDTGYVNIGDKKQYYLGLQVSDSLKCVLQDSSFFYL